MEYKNYTFDDVLTKAKTYLTKKETLDEITRAYNFAYKAHEGQYRKSGEPYITHLVQVAYILVDLQSGPKTIIAGLLHDTVEDCDGYTYELIAKEFSTEVADLVEAVTKIGKLSSKSEEEFQAENHRKIFIAMAKDIRVILIKLADRLHNIRTLQYQSEAKQKKIARETLEVYAPIAHRLGINTIKSELEDLSLKYLEPEKYYHVSSLLNQKEAERVRVTKIMENRICKMLDEQHIPYTLSGRVKSIYSIYKKMYVKNRKFEEIYDLQALRIITDTKTQCYEILGYIHATYRPIPGRFKDYIAMPKPNLYQSLHTTIVADDGNIFEIQIRTKEMDAIAETGVAAHWRYKENSNYNPALEQKEIEEKLHWFRELISITSMEMSNDAKEYMASLQHDIFEANVYCLTPKGRVIDLPAGSTPLDFAYRIHTEVGHSTIGATVNGVLVPLNTPLQTGDVVDIKTSQTKTLPNEDWLKIVRTNSAKNMIKKALMRYNLEQKRDEIISIGKEALTEALKEDKVLEYRETLQRINNEKLYENFGFDTIDNLYIGVARKDISVNTIINKLKEQQKKEEIKEVSTFSKKKVYERNANSNGIIVPGVDSIAISFSQCCSPIPGDDIVGYISKGQGVKIHRKDCPNIQNEKKRLISVEWDNEYFEKNIKTHYVDIQIKGNDQPSILIDVMNLLSANKISVNSVNFTKQEANLLVFINMCIQVRNHDQLVDIMSSLKTNINAVLEVKRVTKN